MVEDPAPTTTAAPPRTLARNVRVFGATSFLNDTASEMAYWVLPAFLASLGAGPAQLGIIEGIAESVASFAKLGSGYLSDRVGRRKPMVVAGYTLANAVKPVLAMATSWWHVLLIRFADRLAKGVRGVPRDVMLAESVEKPRLGAAFGLLQTMDSAGAIAGPLLALWILMRWDLRAVFWAAAVPGLLSIAVVALGARETGAPIPAKHTGEQKTASAISLGRSFYVILAAVTVFSIGNSSDMFLVLRAQSVGIPARHAPLLGLVFNLTYTTFSWPAGKLSDRLLRGANAGAGGGSRHSIVVGGYLIFAIVYVTFAAAPSRAALWMMMALYGAYYALTGPILRAMVVDTAPREARGRAFGIFFFVTSVATLAASVLTGQLWKHFGPRVPFYVSAGLAVMAAAMLIGSSTRQTARE